MISYWNPKRTSSSGESSAETIPTFHGTYPTSGQMTRYALVERTQVYYWRQNHESGGLVCQDCFDRLYCQYWQAPPRPRDGIQSFMNLMVGALGLSGILLLNTGILSQILLWVCGGYLRPWLGNEFVGFVYRLLGLGSDFLLLAGVAFVNIWLVEVWEDAKPSSSYFTCEQPPAQLMGKILPFARSIVDRIGVMCSLVGGLSVAGILLLDAGALIMVCRDYWYIEGVTDPF